LANKSNSKLGRSNGAAGNRLNCERAFSAGNAIKNSVNRLV
jgi:hypothetical protein